MNEHIPNTNNFKHEKNNSPVKAKLTRALGRLVGRSYEDDGVKLEAEPTSIAHTFHIVGGEKVGNIKVTQETSIAPEVVTLRTGLLDQGDPSMGRVQILAVPDVPPVTDQPVRYKATVIHNKLDNNDVYQREFLLVDIEAVNGQPLRVSDTKTVTNPRDAFNNVSTWGSNERLGVKIEVPAGTEMFAMDLSESDDGYVDELAQMHTTAAQTFVGIALQKAGLIRHNGNIRPDTPDAE